MGEPGATTCDGLQERLAPLLDANIGIVRELSLGSVLQRIIHSARQVVGADYAALGVISVDGEGLEQFVHVGMHPQTVDAIGHLPSGKGLLGALIEEPHPVRLRHLAEDMRSVGMPANHPPMAAFLGVPIRVRREVFGNLYLTRSTPHEFTAEDERVALSLAATAGVAIENARLFDEARRRGAWLEASTDATREVLSEGDEHTGELIAETVHRLAAADHAALWVPGLGGEADPRRSAVAGGSDDLLTDQERLALVEAVLGTGEAMRLDDGGGFVTEEGRVAVTVEPGRLGGAMVLPLVGSDHARGVLLCVRESGGRPFSAAELDMAATFASHLSLALELADFRRDQQRVQLLEDRARIARDLHDHVIQQLFAAGMTVQGATSTLAGRPEAQLLEKVVDIVDDAIGQIRTSIFHLRPSPMSTGSLRSAVLEVVAEVRPILGLQPRVRFEGPVDAVSDAELVLDVRAVVREALTNVARHGQASSVTARIAAEAETLTVEVIDDGQGLQASEGRRSGLANLAKRAEARAGELVVGTRTEGSPGGGPGRGTKIGWSVPLP